MVVTIFQYLDDDNKTVCESVIFGRDERDCFNELWEAYGVGRERPITVLTCEPVKDQAICELLNTPAHKLPFEELERLTDLVYSSIINQ